VVREVGEPGTGALHRRGGPEIGGSRAAALHKSEELLKHLPPSVSRRMWSIGLANGLFTGSEEYWRLYMRELSWWTPKPQEVRVLVIQ
jgi:hypothetical protein